MSPNRQAEHTHPSSVTLFCSHPQQTGWRPPRGWAQSLLSLLTETSASSTKSLTDTPRRNVLPAIWASLSPVTLIQKINHHRHFKLLSYSLRENWFSKCEKLKGFSWLQISVHQYHEKFPNKRRKGECTIKQLSFGLTDAKCLEWARWGVYAAWAAGVRSLLNIALGSGQSLELDVASWGTKEGILGRSPLIPHHHPLVWRVL